MDATIMAGVKIANVSEWCRVNGVDRRTFYRHRQRIGQEGSWAPRSRRPRTSPGATPAAVARARPAGRLVRLAGILLTQRMATSPEPVELVRDFWAAAYAAAGT